MVLSWLVAAAVVMEEGLAADTVVVLVGILAVDMVAASGGILAAVTVVLGDSMVVSAAVILEVFTIMGLVGLAFLQAPLFSGPTIPILMLIHTIPIRAILHHRT